MALSCCQPIQRGPGDDGPKEVLTAGQFARATLDNTSFFRQIPLTGAQPDLLLQRHTTMRLIQVSPSYCRVELDSGEVGFVMTAMLEPVPRKKPDGLPDGPGIEDLNPDVIDPNPPVGPGIPDVLPPTIEPEP